MERARRSRAAENDDREGAKSRSRLSHDLAEFGDKRPEAIAQRTQVDEIQDGPYADRERQRFGKVGLPAPLKSGIESLSGQSMDGVRVHYNSGRPAQLNALAYAQGRDIHLGPGQDHHLPHEAWHIAQQAQGRVRPTANIGGKTPINDDSALELEADRMGSRAMKLGSRSRQTG